MQATAALSLTAGALLASTEAASQADTASAALTSSHAPVRIEAGSRGLKFWFLSSYSQPSSSDPGVPASPLSIFFSSAMFQSMNDNNEGNEGNEGEEGDEGDEGEEGDEGDEGYQGTYIVDDGNEGDEDDEGGSFNVFTSTTFRSTSSCTARSSSSSFSSAVNAHLRAVKSAFASACQPGFSGVHCCVFCCCRKENTISVTASQAVVVQLQFFVL